jgi:electron transfer flavoprotein alpha/beta subunit
MSDRGAIALAMARFEDGVRAYAADADARCFARAAGVEAVESISGLEMGAFDVTLLGRGACAERGDLLPASLAEASGAALVFDVIDVQREADGLMVTRDLGRGARDFLSVRGRAVLVIAESVERGPYVSRYRMNAAKADSVESAARKEQSRVEWEPATPRVRIGDHAARVAGSAVERMNALFGVGETAENAVSLVRGSAEECARHLLRYLSHHGFVERGSGVEWEGASAEAARPQPTPQRLQQGAAGDASIPIRLRRRPRALRERLLATRGPYEVGVDI